MAADENVAAADNGSPAEGKNEALSVIQQLERDF